MSFDTFTHALEVLALGFLFSAVVAVAVGTWIEDNNSCDELPLQRPRLTPDPPQVRKVTFFDQDAPA